MEPSERQEVTGLDTVPPTVAFNLVFLPPVLIQAAYPERLGEELRLNHHADDVIFFFFLDVEMNPTIYLK